MSESAHSISEAELHAYVDNQLDAVVRMKVAHYLATHADDAQGRYVPATACDPARDIRIF